MALYDTEYRFEDTGIPTEDGFVAGSFQGTAYINCHEEGDEFIHDIELVQHRWDARSNGWTTRHALLDKGSPLYILILDTLEREHAAQIADACADFWAQRYEGVA